MTWERQGKAWKGSSKESKGEVREESMEESKRKGRDRRKETRGGMDGTEVVNGRKGRGSISERQKRKRQKESVREVGRGRTDAGHINYVSYIHKPKRETPEKGIRYKVKEKKAHVSSQ